jgi:Tfp pilus assembly protein PilO
MNITMMTDQLKWRGCRTLESLSLLSKLGILLLLITVLTYFFAYQPIVRKLTDLDQAAKQKHSHIKAESPPDANVNQYIASFPSITARAQKLNELVETAKQQDLLLNEVSYKTETNAHQPFNRYQVELSVLASYPEIHRFLNTVSEKMPFVAIESLNLSRKSALDEDVDAHIQFTFYFKRP